jgi:hypothetical protein
MNPADASPLQDLTDQSITPTIDIAALDTTPLTSAADVAGSTTVSPVANSNQSGGFDINAVTTTLTNFFDSGAAVYNNIAKTLGTPMLNGTPTVTKTAVNPPVTLGLNKSQWLMIAGGVAFIGLIFILKKRG